MRLGNASTEIETVILSATRDYWGDTQHRASPLAATVSFGIPLFNGGSNIVDLTCVENVAFSLQDWLLSHLTLLARPNITNGEFRKFKDINRQLFDGLGVEPSVSLPEMFTYTELP